MIFENSLKIARVFEVDECNLKEFSNILSRVIPELLDRAFIR